MDFMGMGILEAVIIMAVGFLVLGPAQTIDAMRKVRGAARQARGMMRTVSEQTTRLLDEPSLRLPALDDRWREEEEEVNDGNHRRGPA